MAAIALNTSGVSEVKRALTTRFPKDKSSHLSEALAAALGFKTSISLKTAIEQSNQNDPDVALLDEDVFLARLAALNCRKMGANDRSLIFDNIRYADGHGILKTRSLGYQRVKYGKSLRLRAWRNMLVAGINAAIDQRLFSVRPGDNRWPDCKVDMHAPSKPHVFALEIAGIPAFCSVHDAGYDELAIHVCLWPTPDGERWVRAAMAGFLAGDAYASGWLERRDGAWLQVSSQRLREQFSCRRERLDQVAGIQIQPKGYADRGSFRV